MSQQSGRSTPAISQDLSGKIDAVLSEAHRQGFSDREWIEMVLTLVDHCVPNKRDYRQVSDILLRDQPEEADVDRTVSLAASG
jgi:hypothetical protein